MTIEAVGSVGELIAAIATIATLFYLARQISQGADMIRAASQQALLDTFFEAGTEFTRDDELAILIGGGLLDFEALDDRAKTKCSLTLGRFSGNLEKRLRLREGGLIDRDTRDSVTNGMYAHRKKVR